MKFKNILIGITISVFSILLSFAVAEIAVRILYPGIIPSTKYDWSSRHKGYKLEKPHTTFRIVVLGDSFTFGQGVSRDETFPKRLESMLNSYGGRIRFEVVNLGFCGLETRGELELLTQAGINPETWQPDERYRGLAYQPDLIILEYTLNDSSTSGRTLEQIKKFDDQWRRGDVVIRPNNGAYSLPVPAKVDKFLTVNSRLYLFSLDRYNQILGRLGLREAGDSAINSMLSRYEDSFDGWVNVKQSLSEMAQVAKMNDLPIVLAIYPQLIQLDNYPFKGIHQKVKWVGDVWGFHTLDLFPAFEGKNGASLWVTPSDGHPNADAHEIAAKAIFYYLTKEGLIPYHKGG
ncbi:MAG: GDSL-type esterase/lipase family protein [Deltaproteobacteria bacterium]|nr:GDSL-type esterase/lipase family protein [Deltaproteobacteria bacterium]